jgi:hypothetical protein
LMRRRPERRAASYLCFSSLTAQGDARYAGWNHRSRLGCSRTSGGRMVENGIRFSSVRHQFIQPGVIRAFFALASGMASIYRTGKPCVFCLLLLVVSISPAQQRPQIGGYFSNVHYASGDALGTAVWIVNSEGDFWATVQTAEGHLTYPVVVPVEVKVSRVKFTVKYTLTSSTGKPADEVIDFEGTVTQAGLKLDSGDLLKRRNSWQ